MSVAAVVRAGPEAGLGDRLWCGWLCASVGSLQSWDDISGGRGTGRGSLRDTVERRLPVHGHLQELGHKVGSCLGLLDSISLHDSALLVQAQIPGPSRTALAIESRGVQDIVILKDALLKATLSCEMRRAVEQPLSVHGHVVTQLGTLDGDYSQPHRDQVEVGERAGVLWGALDAPVGIRLEVETLAAEQFGDDAFELRFRAAVRPRGPPPAQSHLGQQDEQLLLAKGLGAAGTHAPLRRHGPAAPGLADLPLLPDQATGQCRHGAPGGDTPKPAGAWSALGTPSPREARSLTRTFSERSGPDSPPYPQDLRINPRGPTPLRL